MAQPKPFFEPSGHLPLHRGKAKKVTVALSTSQAEAFLRAIAKHRRLEKLILRMPALSQVYLLNAIPGRAPAACVSAPP